MSRNKTRGTASTDACRIRGSVITVCGLLTFVMCGLLAACNPLHTSRKPTEIRFDPGQSVWMAKDASDGETVDDWWTVFDDNELNGLIDTLHAQNLDLEQAWHRLSQARAVQEAAFGSRLPSADVNAAGGRSRVVGFLGEPDTVNQFSGSIGVAYEIDLWNKLGQRERAAEYEWQATRLDAETIATSLTARCVNLWMTLIELRAVLALLREQEKTNATLLELVRARYGNGLARASAVLQQEAQLESTRRLIPSFLNQLERAEIELSTMLGAAPASAKQHAGRSADLPELPELPALGVPAALLSRRPDIKAATVRVAAADERIGAALADRLPSFRIQASVGAAAQSLTELVDRWVWSLVASASAPLFDGGRRAAEVERARAGMMALLAGFKATYLRGMAEVETALLNERRQREVLNVIDGELRIARQLLSETQAQYIEGLSDYLPVLNALQSVQRLERAKLSSTRALLSNRVELYRALGGAWTSQMRRPKYEGG